MPSSGILPASRFDIISVVASGLFGAFFSETPGDGKTVSIILGAASNIWAIVSSILTAKDLIDDTDLIFTHLWIFMMAILFLTIVTSACSLLSIFLFGECCSDKLCSIGMLVTFGVLALCLVQLNAEYGDLCDNVDEANAPSWCQYSSGDVKTALWLTAGIAVFGFFVLMMASLGDCDCRCAFLIIVGWLVWIPHKLMERCPCNKDEEKGFEAMESEATWSFKHSEVAATMNRTSAFVKVCLFSVYWYFVDGDMSWGHVIDDLTWWVSGQWAKHGAAFANVFLNRC